MGYSSTHGSGLSATYVCGCTLRPKASPPLWCGAMHAVLWVFLIVSYFSAGSISPEDMSNEGSLGITMLQCAPLKLMYSFFPRTN